MSNRKSNWKSRKIVQFAYFNLGLEYSVIYLPLLYCSSSSKKLVSNGTENIFPHATLLNQIWHSSTKDINFRFSWISSFFRIPHQLKHVHSSKSPPMKKIVEYHVPKNASFQLGQIGLLVLPIVSILESTVGYLCPFATERFWPYPRQQPRVKT